MITVNIHHAKTHLSKLIDQAAKGEAFVIAKAGKPLVKVVPIDMPELRQQKRLGALEGQFLVPDDSDTLFRAEIGPMFEVSARHAVFRRALIDTGYTELPFTSRHAAGVFHLPPIHKDPFDRLLIAQALAEGVWLITTDHLVSQYPGPIRQVT